MARPVGRGLCVVWLVILGLLRYTFCEVVVRTMWLWVGVVFVGGFEFRFQVCV